MRQSICKPNLSFSLLFLAGHLRYCTCHLGKSGGAILAGDMGVWTLAHAACFLVLFMFYPVLSISFLQ